MKFALYTLLVLSGAFLAGCSDSTSGGADAVGASEVAGKDLDGTWETACTLLPTQMIYARTRLVYANLKLTGTYSDYADAACTQGLGVSTWTGGATVPTPGGAGTTPLNLAFESYEYKPLNAQAATTNNTYMYCGLTDWAAGVQRNVMDRPCYGFAIPTGGKSLDIYKTDGKTLKFGQGSKIGVNPSESERPTAIDDTRVFSKLVQ